MTKVMKKTNPLNIISIIIIIASFALAFYFYPQMPEKMASHWNASGNADGYMAKCWALFLMPYVSLGLLLLFLVLPKIDPLKKNIESFKTHYHGFVLLIIMFLFYIDIISIIWNMGYAFNMTIAILPPLAILFYCIGILLEKSKRNWFIGIRTPWTLSSDYVWEKTHKLGGKLFKIAAIISLAGMFVGKYAFWLLIAPILLASLYVVIYSYAVYKKEKKKS